MDPRPVRLGDPKSAEVLKVHARSGASSCVHRTKNTSRTGRTGAIGPRLAPDSFHTPGRAGAPRNLRRLWSAAACSQVRAASSSLPLGGRRCECSVARGGHWCPRRPPSAKRWRDSRALSAIGGLRIRRISCRGSLGDATRRRASYRSAGRTTGCTTTPSCASARISAAAGSMSSRTRRRMSRRGNSRVRWAAWDGDRSVAQVGVRGRQLARARPRARRRCRARRAVLATCS